MGSRGIIWNRRKSVSLMPTFSGQMSSMSGTLSWSKSSLQASPRPSPEVKEGGSPVKLCNAVRNGSHGDRLVKTSCFVTLSFQTLFPLPPSRQLGCQAGSAVATATHHQSPSGQDWAPACSCPCHQECRHCHHHGHRHLLCRPYHGRPGWHLARRDSCPDCSDGRPHRCPDCCHRCPLCGPSRSPAGKEAPTEGGSDKGHWADCLHNVYEIALTF